MFVKTIFQYFITTIFKFLKNDLILMTSKENELPKGLPLGSKIPIKEVIDIENNTLNFNEILKSQNGILIDFFRGAW